MGLTSWSDSELINTRINMVRKLDAKRSVVSYAGGPVFNLRLRV
jgi:hypothetical protein